jgi:hypothetical protein
MFKFLSAVALACSITAANAQNINGNVIPPQPGAAAKNLGIYTPQQFNLTAGAGGDDAAAIQAAVDAAVAAGGGTVYFPPPSSGNYNVCSTNIAVNTTAPAVDIRFEGSGPGTHGVRILPGCASPPAQVFYINAWDGTTQSHGRITFHNMRIDGYCLSKYGVHVNSSVGAVYRNTVIRNSAVGSGSSNFQQDAGYETDMDFTVRLENINDTGHTCYSSGAEPDYNYSGANSDSHVSAVAVNAKIANYFATNAGMVDFSHAHGWGYTAGTDNQPDLRPQYTFKINGNAILIGAIADSFLTTGFYIYNAMGTPSWGYGGILQNSVCEGSGPKCIELDNTTNAIKYWTIMGNNTNNLGTPPIQVDGTLDPSNNISDNTYTTQSNGKTYTTFGVSGSETQITVNNPYTLGWAQSNILMQSGGWARALISAMQQGLTNASNLVFYTYNSSGIGIAALTLDQNQNASVAGAVSAVSGFKFNGTAGFTGTKTAGSCLMTIQGGIITNVTGC